MYSSVCVCPARSLKMSRTVVLRFSARLEDASVR